MQLDWRFDVGPGQLGVSWLVSWLDSFTLPSTDSTAPSDEFAGTIGGLGRRVAAGMEVEPARELPVARPDRRRELALHRCHDGRESRPDPAFRIPRVQYFDLNANYEFSSVLARGTVARHWRRKPNRRGSADLPEPRPGQHRPVAVRRFGRRYYANLSYSF